MSLDKAILSGKEKRKPYTGAKAVDCTCRNNGSCDYCKSNRLYSTNKRLLAAESQLEDLDFPEKTLAFQSSLSLEEIEANFEGVEVFDGVMAALKEVANETTSPIGRDAMEFIDSFLSPEEIEESNRRVDEEAHAEYVADGCNSRPIEELWAELELDREYDPEEIARAMQEDEALQAYIQERQKIGEGGSE